MLLQLCVAACDDGRQPKCVQRYTAVLVLTCLSHITLPTRVFLCVCADNPVVCACGYLTAPDSNCCPRGCDLSSITLPCVLWTDVRFNQAGGMGAAPVRVDDCVSFLVCRLVAILARVFGCAHFWVCHG
jgi:hypothetical protein